MQQHQQDVGGLWKSELLRREGVSARPLARSPWLGQSSSRLPPPRTTKGTERHHLPADSLHETLLKGSAKSGLAGRGVGGGANGR